MCFAMQYGLVHTVAQIIYARVINARLFVYVMYLCRYMCVVVCMLCAYNMCMFVFTGVFMCTCALSVYACLHVCVCD